MSTYRFSWRQQMVRFFTGVSKVLVQLFKVLLRVIKVLTPVLRFILAVLAILAALGRRS